MLEKSRVETPANLFVNSLELARKFEIFSKSLIHIHSWSPTPLNGEWIYFEKKDMKPGDVLESLYKIFPPKIFMYWNEGAKEANIEFLFADGNPYTTTFKSSENRDLANEIKNWTISDDEESTDDAEFGDDEESSVDEEVDR
eukprot:GHVP01060331.1.p1 GENE.GHVP01060331.1~~GHVP01060331.1.p1  ORF type:complete len:142 (+),score=24.25 GHVP01060331.1:164-589(+)